MAGRLIDYLAQGEAASLPDPTAMSALIQVGGVAFYYAFDTETLHLWNQDTVAWDVLTSGGGASSLADLTDVDFTTPPTEGQVIIYDSVEAKWKPGDQSGGGGGGGGGAAFWSMMGSAGSSTAHSFAAKAAKVSVYADCHIIALRASTIPNAGAVSYMSWIAEIDPATNEILEVLASSGNVAAANNDNTSVRLPFTEPVSVVTGKTYALGCTKSISGGAPTSPTDINQISNSGILGPYNRDGPFTDLGLGLYYASATTPSVGDSPGGSASGSLMVWAEGTVD